MSVQLTRHLNRSHLLNFRSCKHLLTLPLKPQPSCCIPTFTHNHMLKPNRHQQSTMSSSTTTTSSTPHPDPIVEQLKQYTTCDISGALVTLKFRNGGFLSGLTLWSPERQAGTTRIVGPAYTVQYAPLSDPRPKLPTHYIDGVPAGAVVFISCPPRTPNAVYGGLMTARARALGAVGSVIDGRFRDLHEQREMGFPVFGRDVGTAPPHELVKVVAVGVAVKLATEEQDMEIRPGDYIVGDLNGVVVVPKELAAEALPLIKKSVEADDQMMVAVQKGMAFEEASKKFRG